MSTRGNHTSWDSFLSLYKWT